MTFHRKVIEKIEEFGDVGQDGLYVNFLLICSLRNLITVLEDS
jgi:hypothetical protein